MAARPYTEYQMKIRESIRQAILELPEWRDSDPFTANFLAEKALARLIAAGLAADGSDNA